MKKSMFLVALAAVSLASCSHDEVVELKSNEIKFTVVADNASRAATGEDQGIFCANNLMPSFKLYAITQSKTYINGDIYTVNSATDVTSTDTRYWPDTEVDFYATYNEGTNAVVLNGDNAPTLSFNVADDVAKQTDLLYATAANKKRNNDNKTADAVALNFRHALSQIVFQARNENKNLRVEVKGVKIGHCYNASTFTFPINVDTQNNIIDHTQAGTDEGVNRGTWDLTETTKLGEMHQYEVILDNAVKIGDTNTSLTAANDITINGDEGYNSNAMLVLPTLNSGETKGTKAWEPKVNVGYNGTFIAVKCKIWNVSGEDETNDILLHGTAEEYAYAVIPVSFKWQQGKKYVYTFVFTHNGNGGYEDDPEDPKPVLVPMKFEVTVDDFQKGTTDPAENEMKTE